MRMTELLEANGIPFHDGSGHHHARYGWVQVDCPFCTPGSGRFRMGYNTGGRYWNCYACGSYRLWEGLKAVLNVTDKELGRILKGEELEEGIQKVKLRETGKYQPPKGVGGLLKVHKDYLRKRKYPVRPDELEQTWKIRGIGLEGGNFKWRLFIPIIHKGEEVSWTTRATSDKVTLRYITARPSEEKIFHRDLLFGEDFVRHAVVVCEGPLDAIAIGPGAVATMGLGYTKAQLLRISMYPLRVICFDSEPAAQKRASKLAADLSVFEGATYTACFTSGKDAASADRSEIEEIRRKFLQS